MSFIPYEIVCHHFCYIVLLKHIAQLLLQKGIHIIHNTSNPAPIFLFLDKDEQYILVMCQGN